MLRPRNEAERCLLCSNAACTAACSAGRDPARMLRAVRFDRESEARTYVDAAQCEVCAAPCESACVHYDGAVRIREVVRILPAPKGGTVDLSIDFCGVRCENPFFLSSSVVASGYEMCAKAFQMGWSGVVYKTVGFFEPDEVSPRFGVLNRHGTSFGGFRNMEQISDHPLKRDLEVLRRLKEDYPTKVIVGSIMGADEEEWMQLARLCTEAGCDIIECNFSCPQMTAEGMGSDVGIDPELVARYTAAVKRGTDRPVLAKMTPNITNMEVPAIAAIKAGADGLAAINTVKSITGFDLPSMAPQPAVNGKSAVSGYSGKAVKPIALRFVKDLATYPQLKGIPISGIGGIETWHDAAEFLALGCTNVQVTTAVMEYGYRIVEDMIAGLSEYLAQNGYSSLNELIGQGLDHIVDPEDLDRSTVAYPMFDRQKCVGCGRCAVSCYDGGHQAIRFEADRVPRLIGSKCVGCHLCLLVCPAEAISPGRRVPKTHKMENGKEDLL